MAQGPSRHARFELVDGSLPPPASGTDQRSSTRRRLPWLGTSVVALLAVVAALTVGRPAQPASAPPAPPQVPAATSTISTTCDLGDPTCRVVQADRWRNLTASVLRDHLDPDNSYFTGYSYGQGPPYDRGTRLGALGLEVYRLEGGSTEVFVQVAKTPADALRCGQLTRHRCLEQVESGRRFLITSTTKVSDGIEVQYRPNDSYVITLVGRNTTAARPLSVEVADLIETAQDPRLQPPPS